MARNCQREKKSATESIKRDKTILITFNCNEPNLLLATSAKRAVIVHDTATTIAIDSPK
ncbi:hypothetical protein [Phocaeicola paurosaccharolyticus]|uniref:hypothetical protein n=1 Tax=Phocaeicola paurosaccharolyticus TaxID=732242 RepID=UPI000B28E0E7